MSLASGARASILAALLLFLQGSRMSSALRLIVYHSTEENSGQGWHNLTAVAEALERAGHQAELISVGGTLPVEHQDLEALQDYDGVLAQGSIAAEVADFAARAGVPVLRFMHERFQPEEFQVNQEWPAALVFASEEDAQRFPYVEEAPRITLAPARVGSAKSISAYAEMAEALAEAKERGKAAKLSSAALKGGRPNGGSGECTTAELQHAKDIGLVMILKNENETIHETLASLRDHIDYWTIVDTGSTDGTQETIKTAMAGVPGRLLSQEFMDFSTTRNWALRAHGSRTAYAFMLDADFRVRDGWRLRITAQRMARECAQRSVVDCGKGLTVWMKLGSTGFFSNRIFPTEGLGEPGVGWHYVYPVHEVPAHDQLTYLNTDAIHDVLRAPGIHVEALPHTHSKSPERWRNLDLRLLKEEKARKPGDTRVTFYLGQTYDLIGDLENALATYQERIDMGGWLQEVFEAHLRRGKLLQKRLERENSLDPMNDTAVDPVPDLLKALQLYPERAEPYMGLSYNAEWMRDNWCHRDADPEVCRITQQVAAFDYARIAAEKADAGVPGGDTLFADLETYEYMAREQLAITAWYVATEFEDAYDVGLEAAQALAAKFPGDEEKASNIAWYEMLRESGSASSGSSVHTSDPGESSAL